MKRVLFFLLIFICYNSFGQIKLSQLPSATGLNSSDLFLLSQGSTSTKLTYDFLKYNIFNTVPYALRLNYSSDSLRLSFSSDSTTFKTNNRFYTFDKPIKVGVDSVTTRPWVKEWVLNHSGSTYLAGSGLTLTGNTFSFGGSVTGSTTLSPLSASALSLDFGSSSNTALRFGQLNFRTYLDANNWTELLMNTSLLSFNGASHRMIQAKKIMSYDADYSSLILQSNDIPSLKKVRQLVYDSTQNIITASRGVTRNVNNIEISSSSAMNNFTWYRSTFLGSSIDFAAQNLLLQSAGSRGGLAFVNITAGSTTYKPSIEISSSGSTTGTGDDFSIDIDSSGMSFKNDGNEVADIDSSGNITASGDISYALRHGLMRISGASYTPDVTQNVAFKLTPGMTVYESSGITLQGDTIIGTKAGSYIVTMALAISGNTTVDWNIELDKNNSLYTDYAPVTTTGTTNIQPLSWFWYVDLVVNDRISFKITNLTNSTDPIIKSMKILIQKLHN